MHLKQISALFFLCSGLMAQSSEKNGWINVTDYGASASGKELMISTTAGSEQVTIRNISDFKEGQGVTISKCYPHYERMQLRGLQGMYQLDKTPFNDVIEIRGFDGSAGDWIVFIIDVTSDKPRTFRWSDDLAISWKGTGVPVTWDWQKLSGGVEVRFKKRDIQAGQVINFTASTLLFTTIDKIEGNNIFLRDKPTRSASNAILRHNDSDALNKALSAAINARKNLFIPNGYYRITESLLVENANMIIEGENPINTVIDISEGTGAVFQLRRGSDVTIRNFTLLGHTGLAEKHGTMTNIKGFTLWCSALKSCQALNVNNTERVMVENVHAQRMSAEAFYCQGDGRRTGKMPVAYTKSLTFSHCSVTDCAANAFNNNDVSENITVEYCRIDGAGWHAYEGPGRFIRLIGNYVRNAGPFTIGDMSHRYEDLNDLGSGQAIVRDNVFESGGRCGGIVVNYGARQVSITNNIFVNYNGNAITVSGRTARVGFPSRNITISGNSIDLSYRGKDQSARTGIIIDASQVIASDNQVYVRGDRINETSGISIVEGIEDVIVHDNIINNCGTGLKALYRESGIENVVDSKTFTDTRLPLEWHISSLYKDWKIVWLKNNRLSEIQSFNPDNFQYLLKQSEPDIKKGDIFHVFPPEARWNIHDNTISGCGKPVDIDIYGSSTTIFRNNMITRGDATDVKSAFRISGNVSLTGNQFQGFDRAGSIALELLQDKTGRKTTGMIRDNIFHNCAVPVIERTSGLWQKNSQGNLYSSTESGTLKPLTSVKNVP